VNPILEVKGVTKAFGGVVANNNITLEVPEGRIVGLIGPNGSGKTTLFNSIVGYHPIDAGSIRFEGRELSRLRVGQIARLGLLRTFQQTRIFEKMTCVQNMLVSVPRARQRWWSMLRRSAPQDLRRAEELLQFVGLYAKRLLPAGDMSFGQQKLLELAMALMNQPRMLLLDEPTAGINPTLINGLMNRLRRANREFGITLLVIEHNMRVIMNLAEYIYCLAHGELLAEGKPEQVRKNSRVVEAYLGTD
jgi:ABC-type branched-subunit amino acid transport system ATPase component